MSRMDELARKLESQKGLNKAELEHEKQEWLAEIRTLFEKVNQWLAPLKEKKLVDLKYDDIEMAEDFLGRYTAKKLQIEASGQTLEMTPIARFIVGSKGRIDVKCGSKLRLLVLQEDGWKQAIKERGRFIYLPFDNEEDFAQMFDEMIE